MIKGKELLNRPIIAISSGDQIDVVRDVVFDPQGNRVLALLVDEGGWFSAAKAVPFDRIRSIGPDAVMIASPADITSEREDGQLKQALHSGVNLIGMNLVTTDGQTLGKIADVYFDERSGVVEGYEATGGLFSDITNGRSFIPAPENVQIGKDTAVVPITVAVAMQEQPRGGLRGALQSATQGLSGVVQGAAQSVRGAVDDVAGAAKERQRDYAVGKVAGSDVSTDSGAVIVRRGETVTAEHARQAEAAGKLGALVTAATGGAVAQAYGEVRERVQEGADDLKEAAAERQRALSEDLTAALTPAPEPVSPEDALGRRVLEDVRARTGLLVAVPGQIVSPTLLARAQELGVAQELLAATAPATAQAAPGLMGSAGRPAAGVGEAISSAAQQAGQAADEAAAKLSAGTSRLFERAKNWVEDRRDDAEEAIRQREDEAEAERIRAALGRPVSRAVLTSTDQVVLAPGELVTHQAVARAQAAGVLDLLLDSVEPA